MGKDPGAADARGGGETGLRAGSAAPRRAARNQEPTDGEGQRFGPYRLNEPELARWGERIGASIELPAFVALRGDLGAGKSVLARAIARGAGVRVPMPSPTFNLLFEYDAPQRDARIQHLDLYRLAEQDEVWEIGWSELGQGRSIVLLEWPERAEPLLPADRVEFHIGEIPNEPLLRSIEVVARGRAPQVPAP